jgi:hypothetical protein
MSFVIKNIDYKKFIEDNFMVLDLSTQQPVPFRFDRGPDKRVQQIYYDVLKEKYPDMNGVREIVLKARREGMSSLILALFTVDFLLRPYSVSICISHKKDVTELLFRQVKFFLESFVAKKNEKLRAAGQEEITISDILKTETKGMIENRLNNAMFYIGTAGSKVGGRGGFARNIHFSEAAFYQDTELITAQEMISGTAQQVPLGQGMIFIESTANGEGNFYQSEWNRAYVEHTSTYNPRFFGWDLFYTQAEIQERRKDFPSDAMWKQEYPLTPDDAFRHSGSPFFDQDMLQAMIDKKKPMLASGRFAPDGEFV